MSSGSSSKIKHARYVPLNMGQQSMTDLASSAAAREGGMVIVRVGEDGTDYQVHRASLKEHSEYFQKALNGRWKEADESVVRLEDVTCSTCKYSLQACCKPIDSLSRCLRGLGLYRQALRWRARLGRLERLEQRRFYRCCDGTRLDTSLRILISDPGLWVSQSC